MLFGMVTQIFCGNMTGLVNSYELHVFFRCLSAICCCQMYTAGSLICKFHIDDDLDWFKKTFEFDLLHSFWYNRWKTKNNNNNTFWAILVNWGYFFTASCSIFWKLVTSVYGHFVANHHSSHIVEVKIQNNRKYLRKLMEIDSKIWFYIYRWIPDSPRWLVSKGRIEEARDILIESAIINDRKHVLPSNLEYLLRQQAYNIQNDPPSAGWWTLWNGGRKAIRHMICVHICWSIYIITYYGMLLNIRSFSRDHLEINTMIAGNYLEVSSLSKQINWTRLRRLYKKLK